MEFRAHDGSSFKEVGLRGLKRGAAGYLWLLKILIPISFGTALLIHTGWLYRLDFLIQPVMGILSLPASAALPMIIGVLTGIYGAVAAMAAMPLTVEQMTLIAVFLLIAHNLIQESMVQGLSGFNPFLAGGFRLFSAFMVTWAVSGIMDVPAVLETSAPGSLHGGAAFSWQEMLGQWGGDMAGLAVQIFLIIMPLMVCLEVMKAYNIIVRIERLATPVLKIMGLSRTTGMLWLTAAVFGLAYGSAVIVEETRNNAYSRDELIRLHLSIGINHAMIEDPALFLPLGILPFWLWVPRLAAAIFAIYLLHLINFVRRHYAHRTCHKKFCDH